MPARAPNRLNDKLIVGGAMLKVGIFTDGQCRSVRTSRYQAFLQSAEIAVEAADPDYAGRYCIFLLDEPDEQACRLITDSSRSGKRQILAVEIARSLRAAESLRLLEAGASDVLVWTDDQQSVARIKARLERWAALDDLLGSAWVQREVIGESPAWRTKLRELAETAHFTHAPVLLMGESGTGKELAARLIHELDPRPTKAALQVLDCTTIVPELAGSEFFGHERGAFTGAIAQREGAFGLANGGTLFLDEIGELSMPMQAQLLRVIQEGTFKRVGGNNWLRTEFRLICATNRDLAEQVRCGKFRADLYFRIASLVHTLPPLRKRHQDIILLAQHFMREFGPDGATPELDEATRDYLLQHDYLGNVRELRQRVARLMHSYVGGGLLSVGHIPRDERRPTTGVSLDWQGPDLESIIRKAITQGASLKEISRFVEDLAVQVAVSDVDGNLQRAARMLGVTDRALQMRRANRRQGDASNIIS